jgi:hypothetical protein
LDGDLGPGREGVPHRRNPATGQQSTRTACVKLTGSDIGALYIFGAVLPWGSDTGDDPGARTETDKESKFCTVLEAQRQAWENIRDLDADPDVGFCLAGDFNKELFGSPSVPLSISFDSSTTNVIWFISALDLTKLLMTSNFPPSCPMRTPKLSG